MSSKDNFGMRSNVRASIASQRQNDERLKPSRKSFTSNGTAANNKKSKLRSSDVGLEESNISVYVRCRSRNDREIKENSGVVVSTMGHLGKEVVIQTGPMAVSNKTYTFDRVFGAESDQEMVYEGIAKGVLDEMLEGYNCTVFAYGQTGTGKTYTMSGDINTSGSTLPENAGIIPRTLEDLFKQLEKNPDFSVKISFIELYNEELRDLLVLNNDSHERKVRIFEDPVKKTIIVQGMEEIFIKNASEGMKVLSDGSYKRHVAATQCNDLSSRSHTVFTITVHMKELDPISGEEYLKIGKLNLVDLAGSENISRSGAENKRAREAGMINQSLLTLGRVINALVDQSPHIPYRESKLTRLLQDSLGGQTKTCIIATISPAKVSLEETISTIEYANRAKNIKNKPQVNQSMSKKMMIKEYVQEIERLRNDLNATRFKNGIYVTSENWEQLTAESESRRILVDEQKVRVDVLEEQIKRLKSNFEDQLKQLSKVEKELDDTNLRLLLTNETLENKARELNETKHELEISSLVNQEHEKVEKELHQVGVSLSLLLEEVDMVKEQLYEMVENANTEQAVNKGRLDDMKKSAANYSSELKSNIFELELKSIALSNLLDEKFDSFVDHQKGKLNEKATEIESFSKTLEADITTTLDEIMMKGELSNSRVSEIKHVKNKLKEEIYEELKRIQLHNSSIVDDISSGFNQLKQLAHDSLSNHTKDLTCTFSSINEQLDSQASEIKALKEKVSKQQFKFIAYLEKESEKLKYFQQEEKRKSELDKKELLAKISQLIEAHEQSSLKRTDEKINEIVPRLEYIISKEHGFINTFEDYIDNEWLINQDNLTTSAQDQQHQLYSKLSEINGRYEESLSSKFATFNEKLDSQRGYMESSISNLDAKIGNLDGFATSLKTSNDEALQFTRGKILNIQNNTRNNFIEVAKQFEQFGEELQTSKPELIDDFLRKQSEFIDTYKATSLSNIGNLVSRIDATEYEFDEMNPPKRKKVSMIKEFPKSRTRDEIMKLNSLEIYKDEKVNLLESSASEASETIANVTSTPMPVPDRPTTALNDSTKDINIIKNNNEPLLKRHSSMKPSRPSSSLSHISK